MKYNRFQLFILTLLHFFVDLSCIYFLMCTVCVAAADHSEWIAMAVLYNFLAFAVPVVSGVGADKINQNEIPAGIGCLLVMTGLFLGAHPGAAVVFIGLGNGLFHIGAGRKVLIDHPKKYAPCGMFISSGALGVFLGNAWGSSHIVIHGMFPALMGISAVILFAIKGLSDTETGRVRANMTGDDGSANACINANVCGSANAGSDDGLHQKATTPFCSAALCFIMLFTVVFIRSYYGFQTVYEWKSGFITGLLFTVCVALGKFLGGILADLIGIRTTSTFSLIGAGVLAFFSFESPVCGMISICCFNMTMPLTLSLMHRTLKNRPGYAFGVLMLALFLGTLPSMLLGNQSFASPGGLAFLCAVSLLLMRTVISSMENRNLN